MNRCKWANPKNLLYLAYHDTEWGVTGKSEHELYELFILETFQAGLSWECVLNKRAAFREAYDFFDIDTVCNYGEEKINALLENPALIRNRLKILSSVQNSRIFRKIQKEFGSFGAYIESFTGKTPIFEPYTLRSSSPLSDAISKDLKKRGMKFAGTTIVYSFLQAAGYLQAHGPECCRYMPNP